MTPNILYCSHSHCSIPIFPRPHRSISQASLEVTNLCTVIYREVLLIQARKFYSPLKMSIRYEHSHPSMSEPRTSSSSSDFMPTKDPSCKRSLDDDSDDHTMHHWQQVSKQKSRRRRKRLTCVAGICFVVVVSIAISFKFFPRALGIPPSGREFGDCGNSVEEARVKGCVFDNLSYSWMRPACTHTELRDQFWNRSKASIVYYNQPDLSSASVIPIEEILRGDWPSAWATKTQHPVHCAFVVAKIHEAFTHHLPLDSGASNFEHTVHCSKVLLDDWLGEVEACRKPGGCGASKVTAKFTTCGYM
jgi:hypothetical protein